MQVGQSWSVEMASGWLKKLQEAITPNFLLWLRASDPLMPRSLFPFHNHLVSLQALCWRSLKRSQLIKEICLQGSAHDSQSTQKWVDLKLKCNNNWPKIQIQTGVQWTINDQKIRRNYGRFLLWNQSVGVHSKNYLKKNTPKN